MDTGLRVPSHRPKLCGAAATAENVRFPVKETLLRESFWLVDVGPILRQVITRTDGFFGDLLSLTLFEKLVRGQVPECAMWAAVIVIHPPRFDDGLGLGERGELVHVQTLISQSSVK